MKIDIENILTPKFGATLPAWTKPFLLAVDMLDILANVEAEQSTSDEEDNITHADYLSVTSFRETESNLQAVSIRSCMVICKC